ncbi:MAG TPA: trigger factor [Candidatus Aminicenantes bacterium]|nr:trigger factor [Candidatus Aminicenantes bacterium]HRY65152.1 trigger factor [Candidatus Aminicenantes bacterium]HRZ72380.1 trigger factor [Candidatus Aminicenantes bacterium]
MNEQERRGRLTDVSPSRKEIELEIPDEEFRREYDRVLGEYVGKAKLDGFRKGHAPREQVRALFDHEIRHDVYDALIPRVLEEELKGLRLSPVNVPELKDLKHEDGQPLRATAAFEVLPDFELPDYRSVRVQKKPVEVADADVDKALEDLRARAAEYVPVEGRGVAAGDYAVVEMQGRDLASKRLLPVEKAVVLAGHADNEPALNEKLLGLAAGEERSFEVAYPKEHANRRVAGKTIVYSLKLREIKEKKLPGLDDDFAKTMGVAEGLAALRDKVRRELLAGRERASQNETASEVLKAIAAKVSLELPESAVDQESLAILRRLLSVYRDSRLAPEAVESLKAEARRQAVEHLTNHLILEKIAQKEGLGVSEEEIQAEIRSLAQANGIPEASLADRIRRDPSRREEMAENLLFRKAVDFLMKTSIMS